MNYIDCGKISVGYAAIIHSQYVHDSQFGLCPADHSKASQLLLYRDSNGNKDYRLNPWNRLDNTTNVGDIGKSAMIAISFP